MKSKYQILSAVMLLLAGKLSAAEDVRLLIPEKIYAVPGVESNVYFNNVVTVINPANYVFDVDCQKGRNEQKRWHFTPKKSDVGTWKWKIKVINETGIVAEGNSELVVLPPEAGENRKISMLIIGASYIRHGYIPFRVVEQMKKPGNPDFHTIGTRSMGDAKFEGYGGWRWKSFLTNWGVTGNPKNDGMHPNRPVIMNSPFLFADESGKGVFDLKQYFQRNNEGRNPDAVSFQLGINDILLATDDKLAERTEESIRGMEELIAEFRKLQPAPEIFVCTGVPGSNQDGFGANYGCGQTSWQFRKNLDFYIRTLQKKSKDLHFRLVPMFINLDTENNFPVKEGPVNEGNPQNMGRQNNAIHPTRYGYYQMGDTLYCELKAWLAESRLTEK